RHALDGPSCVPHRGLQAHPFAPSSDHLSSSFPFRKRKLQRTLPQRAPRVTFQSAWDEWGFHGVEYWLLIRKSDFQMEEVLFHRGGVSSHRERLRVREEVTPKASPHLVPCSRR